MDILEQIFDQGYATKEVSLAKGKIKATVRNLATSSQLEIEQQLSKMKDSSSAFVLHQYSMGILSHTLVKLNDKKFKKPEEVTKALLTLPTAVCDGLITAQNLFEKEVARSINPEGVDKSFFGEEPTPDESGQSPEELSSEKKEA